MATGHSRNKRGRGNPRARHGPASQPRPANSAGRGPSPATRPAGEATTSPTEMASPTVNGPRPPSPSGAREPFAGDGPRPPRQGKRPGARPPREAGRNDANRGSRRFTEGALAVQANGVHGVHSVNGIHRVSGEYGEHGEHGEQNPTAPLPPAEPPSPHAEHAEEASATETTSADVISADLAPARAAEPPPRPTTREHGWRALPPRGARPREEPSASPSPATFASPSNLASFHQASARPTPPPAARAARGPEAEEPEELAKPIWHPERSPQRSPNGTPSGIVAPNGHAPFRPEVRGALGPLIDSLHDLFAHDRAIASQGSNARCGICYLHHPLSELDYYEAEGFYICSSCQQALGHHTINMVRRQQR